MLRKSRNGATAWRCESQNLWRWTATLLREPKWTCRRGGQAGGRGCRRSQVHACRLVKSINTKNAHPEVDWGAVWAGRHGDGARLLSAAAETLSG